MVPLLTHKKGKLIKGQKEKQLWWQVLAIHRENSSKWIFFLKSGHDFVIIYIASLGFQNI